MSAKNNLNETDAREETVKECQQHISICENIKHQYFLKLCKGNSTKRFQKKTLNYFNELGK